MKKCGVAECSISDTNYWSDECDRKSDEDSYTCTSCCNETMCNGASKDSELKRCALIVVVIYQMFTMLIKYKYMSTYFLFACVFG